MSHPVSIVMGSDSDLPVMERAGDILSQLGVGYELDIVSAHRTPQRLFEYASELADRGIGVVIAGAGGAAHLPGMIAAITSRPVIGVPISATKLEGEDALLSIVQMPAGVPVACVAIDNATNAGLLAAQIIALTDPQIDAAVRNYKQSLSAAVLEKSARVRRTS